jgi:hypothetical protein
VTTLGQDTAGRYFLISIGERCSGFRTRLRCLQRAATLQQGRHQPGPAGLMTGSQTRAIVTVEVFIEKNEVAPVWIFLEHFAAAVDWASAVSIDLKNRTEAPRDRIGYFRQRHRVARTGRALDPEGIPIIFVKLEQCAHNQHI